MESTHLNLGLLGKVFDFNLGQTTGEPLVFFTNGIRTLTLLFCSIRQWWKRLLFEISELAPQVTAFHLTTRHTTGPQMRLHTKVDPATHGQLINHGELRYHLKALGYLNIYPASKAFTTAQQYTRISSVLHCRNYVRAWHSCVHFPKERRKTTCVKRYHVQKAFKQSTKSLYPPHPWRACNTAVLWKSKPSVNHFPIQLLYVYASPRVVQGVV